MSEDLAGLPAHAPTAIRLYMGGYFDLAAPDGSTLSIWDVAVPLARIPRFTGHTAHPYSVAEHSLLASLIVPPEDALAALLHDAHEAVWGDDSRPKKVLLRAFWAGYRDLEDRLQRVVMKALGWAGPLPASVKLADNQMLKLEQRVLMGAEPEAWRGLEGVREAPVRIRCLNEEAAASAFVARWRELGGFHR